MPEGIAGNRSFFEPRNFLEGLRLETSGICGGVAAELACGRSSHLGDLHVQPSLQLTLNVST